MVDTNIWIRFLIGRTLRGFGGLLLEDRVVLLQSEELFNELLEVLARPKFRPHFSCDDVRELIELMGPRTEWVEAKPGGRHCRDPKDDFLLDLCIAGRADLLVTGDKDLLVLGQVDLTSVVHYRDLMACLNRRGQP